MAKTKQTFWQDMLGDKKEKISPSSKAMQRGLEDFPHERLHQEAIAPEQSIFLSFRSAEQVISGLISQTNIELDSATAQTFIKYFHDKQPIPVYEKGLQQEGQEICFVQLTKLPQRFRKNNSGLWTLNFKLVQSNWQILGDNKNKISPSISTRRKKGDGSGSIYCRYRKNKKGEKTKIKQYYFNYEIWKKGRLIKTNKYIPIDKLEEIQEMNNNKVPVREILSFLGIEIDE